MTGKFLFFLMKEHQNVGRLTLIQGVQRPGKPGNVRVGEKVRETSGNF